VRQHLGGFARADRPRSGSAPRSRIQYMSDQFQRELGFLGIDSSPALSAPRKAMAAPSGSSELSKKTCSGCEGSRVPKCCVRLCWHSRDLHTSRLIGRHGCPHASPISPEAASNHSHRRAGFNPVSQNRRRYTPAQTFRDDCRILGHAPASPPRRSR
jgi:hypothetical protein